MFMLDRKPFFFHTSGRSIYFWYIYEAKTIFQRFAYKIQADIYQKTPCRAQTLLKEMRSQHTLIRTTRTFIYPQYCVLLGNRLRKLNELFCNYKETFYVLGTIHAFFIW